MGSGDRYERELAAASAIAREAGALLKERFGRVQEIDFKGRINLVTEMDRRSEALIVKRLAESFPGDDVWAEEGSGERRGRERVWIVDPLDGTTNYAHEYPVWSVSIAFQEAGDLAAGVVYNPLLDDLYAARKGCGATLNGRPRHVTDVDRLDRAMLATGFAYDLSGTPEETNIAPFARFVLSAQAVRRAGSAALAIAKVGVGRTDGFWERGLHPWDMAAAILVVTEGGGKITDYDGRPPALDGRKLVASNGRLHDEILRVIRETRPPDERAST
ncbi:MAG: inositol monophosphatase family protein [Hyphomicrobiales bacterium]